MELPDFLHGRASEIVGVEMNAAQYKEEAERNRAWWAVALGLRPMRDGNKWCLLWGENLQSGVAAFGDTPLDTIRQFEVEMLNARAAR